MAFNVLKDPKDPRNFIVQPVPVAGADPALLAAGQAAGQAGTLARPKPRGVSGPAAPGTGETQFGPGSEEAFARGLFNFRGRLNRKRFEQNKTVFEANLVRDGLNINAPGVRAALNEAYKSTNGFAAATDVAQDFFFNQPENQAQRAVDLKALQDKEQRASEKLLAETTRIQNENEVFKYDLGLPPAKVAEDREKFNKRMTLAGRIRDAQILSDHFGSVRFGESTSSEKAAVKQAYADIKRELTIGIGAASEAGALSDQERDFFGEFAGEFGTLSPIQDSSRRVALGDAMNFLESGSNDIKQANRALMRGARPAVWSIQDRTVDQILSRELPAGLNELTPAEIAVESERASNLAAGTLGPTIDRSVPTPAETISDPEGGRRELSGEAGADFFEGIGDFITQGSPAEQGRQRRR